MMFPICASLLIAISAAAPAPQVTTSDPSPRTETPVPSVNSSTLLGYMNDNTFNPAIYRDGGGAGMTGNGVHVIGFADSMTYGTAKGGAGVWYGNGKISTNGSLTSFVHNTFALMNHTSPGDPLALHDFGKSSTIANGTFTSCTLCANSSTEKALSNDFAIWPNSNLLGSKEIPTLSADQLVGVFIATNLTGGAVSTLYTTLATITVPPTLPVGKPLPAVRNATALFSAADGVMYGDFATFGHGPNDLGREGYAYLFGFAHGNKALKVARAKWSDMADRSAYEFWDGAAWSSTMPAASDTASDVFSLPPGSGSTILQSGDVFYSEHFGVPVLVYGCLGTFYVSVATDRNHFSFGAPVKFYSAPKIAGIGGYMYSPHAYPHWDESGKTLLLSWADTSAYVRMAKVTWN